ncbi:uncharacterized protein [Leptinotarsa decemlineata]|uniref:uncharacterized protein n=1 Tax=Leptinotarsa decemlineata TaxID=7539 RepID=UPI003D303EE0
MNVPKEINDALGLLPATIFRHQPQPESIYPEHMEQVDFMGLFGVGTHEFHDLMVKKRSMRKKRAAARPDFYRPVDLVHRKKQKNKEKYSNRKVSIRKTKPRDSHNEIKRLAKRKPKKR